MTVQDIYFKPFKIAQFVRLVLQEILHPLFLNECTNMHMQHPDAGGDESHPVVSGDGHA